jgi:hypothetical protein
VGFRPIPGGPWATTAEDISTAAKAVRKRTLKDIETLLIVSKNSVQHTLDSKFREKEICNRDKH